MWGTRKNLVIAKPTPIRDIDPFLGIQRKIASMVNLEVTRQIALAITDSGEEEALAPRKRTSFHKRKGKGVKTPNNALDV